MDTILELLGKGILFLCIIFKAKSSSETYMILTKISTDMGQVAILKVVSMNTTYSMELQVDNIRHDRSSYKMISFFHSCCAT